MTEQDNHPDPYAPVWGEQNPADDTRVIRPIAAQNVIQPGQEIRYRDGKAEVVWSDPQAPPLWHTAAAYGAPRRPMPARRPPEGYGPPPQLHPAGYPMTYAPARPSSTVSVWAIVLGIVGVFGGWCLFGLPCIAAIILGHVGLADTKDGGKSGRGMAVTGLVTGYVMVLPAIILFFWMVLGAGMGAVTPSPSPSF
jgi:hypothetical protein